MENKGLWMHGFNSNNLSLLAVWGIHPREKPFLEDWICWHVDEFPSVISSSEVKSQENRLKIEMAVTKDLTSSSKFSGSCGLTFQTALQRSRMKTRSLSGGNRKDHSNRELHPRQRPSFEEPSITIIISISRKALQR